MAKPLLAYPRPSSLSQRHPATPSVRAFEARDASPAPERSGSQSKEDSGREWAEERKRLRAERVQNALQAGRMGLGFSAGGFLYGYHLGVLWELTRLKILPPPGHAGALKMAGSSAGSLAIVTYACGLDVEVATQAMLSFAEDCRRHGTHKRITSLLWDFLHEHLPEDAHERCEGLVHVGLTRVFPVWKPEVVAQWESKDDLVASLVASCHIPVYANGDFMTKFRGRWYMDGGLTGFIPKPPDVHTVKVCCFPANAMLERIAHPSLEANARVASFLDVSISPDAFPTEDFQASLPQYVQWALVPAEDEILKKLILKGRHDAHAWAMTMGLVPTRVEAGNELQPVPGEGAVQKEIAAAAGKTVLTELQRAKNL
eukprot:CAMPEP_0202370470 /NCGR_PEP_ID=MMETSP1127-20130417/2068_1 /ASSEMBLY_ACC=CAM_ASM_000462 /TAXON_ID=3047 /ORGANISM="Dunaliella tertiolecta, Strain CCMP1320" /LENGTH=371 /DNA_ID=CAMNT_0048966427 /DNA_START=96 /DNA_END=1211 /DNA_ORIENTATION=-